MKISLSLRLTAFFAVVLILALSIFAVCPQLHAMLHAAEHGKSVPLTSAKADHGHDGNQTDTDDDVCAVTTFAQGVLIAAVAVLLGLLAWRVIPISRRLESIEVLSTPRNWLPPMCGPPLS